MADEVAVVNAEPGAVTAYSLNPTEGSAPAEVNQVPVEVTAEQPAPEIKLPVVIPEIQIEARDLAKRIKEILAPDFIFYDKFADVLALALASKRNVWFYGDGGYGKSTMVEAAFKGLGLLDRTFIQSFGQGMTPEKLVGNLDIKELNDNGKFRYNIDESFLVHEFAIFEEMPDAALPVLFQLKDTLERKKFRDGVQSVDMKTKTIVVCSNRAPTQVAEYGVDAAALIQRWPFECSMAWPDHNASSYEALFTKREQKMEGPSLGVHLGTLSKLLSQASNKGENIPPRIALEAALALKTAARVAGRAHVDEYDFAALTYVRGMQSLGEDVTRKVQDASVRAAAEQSLRTWEEEVNKVWEEANTADKPISCLKVVKSINKVVNSASKLKLTDSLVAKKNDLINKLSSKKLELHNKATELVTE